MRASLPKDSLEYLFSSLKSAGFSLDQVATQAGVSLRSVSDWRRGKYTLPETSLQQLAKVANVDLRSLTITLSEDWGHTRSAGRKGAVARALKHGPLGTTESRKRGGDNSYLNRKHSHNDIFTRRVIITPARSEALAEFIGIMIGDGCLTTYQTSISVSSLVDVEYSEYVKTLTTQLFGIKPYIKHMKNANCITLTCSSIALVEFLHEQGLPIGNKVKQSHTIPSWIWGDSAYIVACLRGIFDTDGCIFLERHDINGRSYGYRRMSFVSASRALRESIFKCLQHIGIEAKIRNNRSVNIEKSADISKYFDIVGTSNPKHLQRFIRFGGVG